MNAEKSTDSSGQEFGLIVLQEGKPQQVLAKFLSLLLNYQYGLSIMVVPEVGRAAELLREQSGNLRCVCIVYNGEIKDQLTLKALSEQGEVPLLLIMPMKKLGLQRMHCAGMDRVFFCAWEKAFSHSEAALQNMVGGALEQSGIGKLLDEIGSIPYPVLQQRVERRLRNINTLPTLPEIVMRIMRMVNDPKTAPEQLEQVLCTDPAIVMKLLQVMRSPIFMGTAGRTSKWTLKEIIVRLGVKKVGAIAQQVKMINSLVKPEESEFDLRRFWEHSVGSAIIADKLYVERCLSLKGTIEFNDYWIGALLHDVGKLVLGFFFWDWFSRVLQQTRAHKCTFRRAEAELGNVANHERISQLMLLNADMGEEVVASVGQHHELGEQPSELTCLVHVANNLCKDLGLSYLPGEEGGCDEKVLGALKMNEAQLEDLRDSLGAELVGEVKAMVEHCI